ncbi:MAG: aminotransferase class V-fold PLP-dependent enzyme [Candidatus Methylomirabilales bacterium]
MEEAARIMALEMPREGERICRLRDRLEAGVLARIEESRVNGHKSPRLPHTSNLAFDGIEAQTLVAALDLEGVAVSAGSACHVGSVQPSHVLRAMRLSPAELEGSIRVSLGRPTRDTDIDHMLEILPPLVARLREHASAAR